MAVHLDEYTLSTTLIGDISLSDKGKMAEGALSQLSIAWRARNISSAAGWAHALFLISPELFKKLKILYFQWDSPFLEGSAVKFSRLYSGGRITFSHGSFFQDLCSSKTDFGVQHGSTFKERCNPLKKAMILGA